MVDNAERIRDIRLQELSTQNMKSSCRWQELLAITVAQALFVFVLK